jgi:hypothetical protein
MRTESCGAAFWIGWGQVRGKQKARRIREQRAFVKYAGFPDFNDGRENRRHHHHGENHRHRREKLRHRRCEERFPHHR